MSHEIASLEKKINKLKQKLKEHENDANILENQKVYYKDNSLSDLEKEITTSNNLFLEKLHTKIKQRLKNLELYQKNDNKYSNEQRTIDLHLSANFPSQSENSTQQNSKIIQIETTATLDPGIHHRVQRHSDRISRVEDDFDNLLTIKDPEILPQKQLQQILSASTSNKKQIEELEKKYYELDNSLPDIKKERQEKIEKKRKMKEAKNVPGAVKYSEFQEFTNKIFNQFNDFSFEITCAENELNDSISNLNEHLISIDQKVDDFKQSAADFEMLIKMTDDKIANVELKIQKKSEAISNAKNNTIKLENFAENGEMKIQQLSQEIKSKIDDLKKTILELQTGNQENSP